MGIWYYHNNSNASVKSQKEFNPARYCYRRWKTWQSGYSDAINAKKNGYYQSAL